MKKLFLLLFLTLALFADQGKDAIQAQILEKIFQNIEINKEIILWSDNKTLLKEFEKKRRFKTTKECHEATLLVVEQMENLPKQFDKKAIFVLDYALLKEIPESFGSMFWKKGRPNVVLIKSRFKTHGIKISQELVMYVEEKVW
jgi:hypothetical protein